MSNVKTVKIGDEQYNVTQAPANEQKKLLSLIGAKIALNSAVSGVEVINTDLLFGALLTLREDEFDVIAGIVLYKTVKNGSETIIDVGNFQNSVTNYYRLVAEAIEVNLGDFFTYLDSVNKETKSDQKKA